MSELNVIESAKNHSDRSIDSAWNEFEKSGEVSNNSELLLNAADFYQLLCKEQSAQLEQATKERDELLGKVAELSPIASQVNQWKSEHARIEGKLKNAIKERDTLIAIVENLVPNYDVEELSHYAGIDQDSASRIIDILNNQ